MTNKEIDKRVKDNNTIATFCGYELTKDEYKHPVYKMPDHAYEERNESNYILTIDTFSPYWDEMEFRFSWDWLMPVITKIFSMYGDSEALANYIDIYMNADEMGFHTPIEVCFEKVVNFIEWYETNKTL